MSAGRGSAIVGDVVGQAAEQIIAGVVLSERLAVTMYGAIHRAQFSGQRNMRGLVVDPKMLAESAFRGALTDAAVVAKAIELDAAAIVPTVAVEAGGPDVVVVTRGVGRYVTVQDLITTARAGRGANGRLPLPVAAAIGKRVVEALAVAHAAGVVHGAVHPRSVLVDEDGAVRLGDFIVGRALTTAVAQGADSALWRGLSGFLAPELALGEDPTPACDVFACGALLFTMLSGEVPPGTLHVTPAVERLVQRALDTDLSRRYRSAADLLENLLEAFEDDRWDLADRGEIIKAAGLAHSDGNIDEATEDLLASLGSTSHSMQVTPQRPSTDLRAEAAAATRRPSTNNGNGLDALLADLDDGAEPRDRSRDSREHTEVDYAPFKGAPPLDPISELIHLDPRKKEAIVQIKSRVPTFDDPDDDEDAADHTPLPAPQPSYTGVDLTAAAKASRATDEHAALRALDDLDGVDEPPAPAPARRAAPVLDTPDLDVPPPRLKSRVASVIALGLLVAGGVGFYMIYRQQQQSNAERAADTERKRLEAEERTRRLEAAQADKGTLAVAATPADASIWLKLGRTPIDTMPLASTQMHRIRIELEGYQGVDTEVLAANWTTLPPSAAGAGSGSAVAELARRRATVNVTLKAVGKDRKTGKSLAEPLPASPPNLAVEPTGFEPGEGPIHVETSPPGAEVWLLIGYGSSGASFPTIAGRPYELRALADGHLPGYAQISADDWRDGDATTAIDVAKKKSTLERRIELQPDPDAAAPERPGDRPGERPGRRTKKAK